MEKPLTVLVEELKTGIAELINNSQLHPIILESVIRDVYTEVQMLSKQQASIEKKQWEGGADGKKA